MKRSVLMGVWVYMVASVLLEVSVFYGSLQPSVVDTVIGIIAASQSVAIATFYMGLKDEPGSVRLLMLVAIMFLSGLLIATVASLG